MSKRKTTGKPLLQKLKDHREKIAKQRHWEPYVFAQNLVLEEIAKKKPRSTPELKEVKGMGKKRTDKFGVAFLNFVSLHERQQRVQGDENRPPAAEADDDSAASGGSHGEEAAPSSQESENPGEPATPSARPPALSHSGLTSLVQRTHLLQEEGSQD